MLSKFRGCLLAGACGDALGGSVEFHPLSYILGRYGPKGITEMNLHGGYAEVTDDTQMDIYTAQGIIHAVRKNCDYNGMVQEIYKSYVLWYRGQMSDYDGSTPIQDDLITDENSKRLYENRAPGNTCLVALGSGIMGTRTRQLNDSKGCGGVMRAAPAGLYYYKNPEMAYELGCDLAAITHSHPLGYQSSGALAMIVANVLQGDAISVAVKKTIDFLHQKEECSEMEQWLQKAVDAVVSGPEYPKVYDVLKAGWVGEEALAIAVWAAMKYPNDLKEAIVKAVNHSGDSDSTGAICGYIIGASLGEEAIPASWLEHLELKDIIVSQADTLCTMTQYAVS